LRLVGTLSGKCSGTKAVWRVNAGEAKTPKRLGNCNKENVGHQGERGHSSSTVRPKKSSPAKGGPRNGTTHKNQHAY